VKFLGNFLFAENLTEKASRTLVLVSKIIQNLANGKVFKEDYMKDFNSFILHNALPINDLFEKLAVSGPPIFIDIPRILLP
jgi:hypothetical protein